MPFINEHANRVRDPRVFVNFSRENNAFAAGVHVMWGIMASGQTQIQSIRFDKTRFTAVEARAWLQAHSIPTDEFDAAIEKSKKMDCAAILASMPNHIRIGGSYSGGVKWLEAAGHKDGGQKLPKFEMVGYSGGLMSPPGFPDVIVDIQGMDISNGRQHPILKDHQLNQIVGHSEKIDAGNELLISGVISGVGEAAKEVIETSKNGFQWQASLGADINLDHIQFLEEGEKQTINGQKQVGPLAIARQSKLRESSFVAIGADSETSASVA